MIIPKTDEEILASADAVLGLEAEAVAQLQKRLDATFVAVCRALFSCSGKVVMTGMGKAGIIATKCSATLASTGTPSVWLHLAEALHGDLGRVEEEDIVVVLSYSGETEELKTVLPTLKQMGVPMVAMTGNPRSYLGKYAEYVLDVSVSKEACPLDLAPTTSTTAMLAFCDAIAVTLQRMHGFEAADYARFHPKGSLGRKLLFRVQDCMRQGDRHPMLSPQASIREALLAITKARAGSCTVVDAQGRLAGIFTDGDLRRQLDQHENLLECCLCDLMTTEPITVQPDMLAAQAMRIMEEKKIDDVPVVDEAGQVCGLLDVQDLLEAGIV